MPRILACVDLSENNAVMLDCATTLAGAEGEVVILHVAQPEPEFMGRNMTGRDGIAMELRQEHKDTQALAAGLVARGVRATSLTVQGAIAERILEHAERLPAEYIVLGARAHWAIHDLVVVSVLKGVIRGARVPVVVAPPHAG